MSQTDDMKTPYLMNQVQNNEPFTTKYAPVTLFGNASVSTRKLEE